MTARGDRRVRAERAGRRAETIAALFLRAKGFVIVARRARTPVGEIDILARRGRLLAVVEVKARADRAAEGTAVPPAARRRIERAAEAIVSQRPELAALDRRFDVVFVRGVLPRHAPDAWRAGD